MAPLLSNSATELDPLNISHSLTILEVYIMSEKNVLSGKAWQRKGGFQLEEKSRDRLWDTSQVLIAIAISHMKSEWSDFVH